MTGQVQRILEDNGPGFRAKQVIIKRGIWVRLDHWEKTLELTRST